MLEYGPSVTTKSPQSRLRSLDWLIGGPSYMGVTARPDDLFIMYNAPVEPDREKRLLLVTSRRCLVAAAWQSPVPQQNCSMNVDCMATR
jgi:hypothetical protein